MGRLWEGQVSWENSRILFGLGEFDVPTQCHRKDAIQASKQEKWGQQRKQRSNQQGKGHARVRSDSQETCRHFT
jgi:hypothetical protein